MRKYFGYIRVSTHKQGEKGSSLIEQKDAITRYANRNNLVISEWFEEQETAAKVGRTVFRQMLTKLYKGQAHGLILHKIDRGARNLKDWSEINSLMDIGVDIHFAHEAIDLNTRGGRLSADIQAVVAADYIRNLRDEVKKGQVGRLKQGHYPWRAPIGYRDQGSGKLKEIEPIQGRLVKEAFELYASGNYPLKRLQAYMKQKGLKNREGRTVSLNGIHTMLRNPFYIGLIRTKNETYSGKHTPLVTAELFARVQKMLQKQPPRKYEHTEKYKYRRLVSCAICTRHLYAESQKERIYYRCHSDTCKGTSIREDVIDMVLFDACTPLVRCARTSLGLHKQVRVLLDECGRDSDTRTKELTLLLANLEVKISRLTDVYLNGTLTDEEYLARKEGYMIERVKLTESIAQAKDIDHIERRVRNFLELMNSLKDMDETAIPAFIKVFAKCCVSNIQSKQKSLVVTCKNEIQAVLAACQTILCDDSQDAVRQSRDKNPTYISPEMEIFNAVTTSHIFDESLDISAI